ncbi:hypothetical protein LAZ67_4002825 [Cordylochernes scorpioides]|uniref:DUF5641 domain-containing protein n=1 Tax=Cordylochernes scorpioides TaxID=51811 RepID=A0ABY6KD54_9ARAC|nr:hypothetical protein LAZ67_4002825 [Cordylochernes scorpioides]
MRTLHQLARDKVSNFPLASKIVQTDFYVNDLLSGADTFEEATCHFVKSIIFFLQRDFLLGTGDQTSRRSFLIIRTGIIFGILRVIHVSKYSKSFSDCFQDECRSSENDFHTTAGAVPCSFFSQLYMILFTILYAYKLIDWIKSESRHWKPFVGNRIAGVQRLTLHSSWHYVISKDNPADCASRGITSSELVDHSLCWRGPPWLSDVNFEDPIQTQYDFPKEISGERRKAFSVFHSTNLFPDFIFKYSNINELVRITAWIYKFVFNVQCSFNERKKGHLSSSELTSSNHNTIRFIQCSEYQSEITCCKQKKSLPTNSKLLSLNPFIDEYGLLRVGEPYGRTTFDGEEDLKPGSTTSSTPDRSFFWRNGINKLVERWEKVRKVSFICPQNIRQPVFCTKAVHIEIVSDLSSAAFLAAFKRFISRRGKPSDILSDNRTNFRGANSIIREQFGLLKVSTNQKFISNERINWHFIPPYARYIGGILKDGIKSFKFHLPRCLKSQILTFEELSTLKTQIEACINSRSICPLNSDSDDFNPLTPGHFLIGRPLTAPPESNDDLDRWSQNQKIKNVFWKRYHITPAMYWSLGLITEVFPGADGKVRVVEVKSKHQERLTRTVSKIVPIPFAED